MPGVFQLYTAPGDVKSQACHKPFAWRSLPFQVNEKIIKMAPVYIEPHFLLQAGSKRIQHIKCLPELRRFNSGEP